MIAHSENKPRPARAVMLAAAFIAIALAGTARAGETLKDVKARGYLRCGISESIAGLSERDEAGEWRGFEVDYCRAVAAALFADPAKVRFLPLTASMRFPVLRLGQIDLLLLADTTWTFTRDALLGAEFAAVLLYDGQSFLVPAGAGIKAVVDLAGKTVCVDKGTRHGQNVMLYMDDLGLTVTLLAMDSLAAAAAALDAGKCSAISGDGLALASHRLRTSGQAGGLHHPVRTHLEGTARGGGTDRRSGVGHRRALGGLRHYPGRTSRA